MDDSANRCRVGLQGEEGSACHSVAGNLLGEKDSELFFYKDAKAVLADLAGGLLDYAVLVLESPQGIILPETEEAIEVYGPVEEIKTFYSEVAHVLLAREGDSSEEIKFVASHPVPLRKHLNTLKEYFPNYTAIEVADTGLAAKKLAAGELPEKTAVIAMKKAADIFALNELGLPLPANDNYLTKFVLVRLAEKS